MIRKTSTNKVLGIRYDKDMSNFIDALNADPSGVKLTQQERYAVHFLVRGLKGIKDTGQTQNVWERTPVLYPVVGGSAFKHKFNAKNPADTNEAFRLLFSGGWSHSNSGALPNGVNTMADTFYIPTLTENGGFGYYSGTNSIGNECEVDNENGTPRYYLYTGFTGNRAYFDYHASGADVNAVVTDSLGFYYGDLNGTTATLYKQGVSIVTGTIQKSTTQKTNSIKLGARWQSTGYDRFSKKSMRLFIQTNAALTVNEVAQLNFLINHYQSILSRNPFRS
jgi:hypothetical protein